MVIGIVVQYPIISFCVGCSLCWKLIPIFTRSKSIWSDSDSNWIEKLIYGGISSFAQDWHEYEVHDLSRIVQHKNNCLLVGYHSRCTLDLLYLVSTIRCHVLVTHLLFYIPIIGTVMKLLGIIPSKGGVRESSERAFTDVLEKGNKPLMLLPGGAFECMKAYHDRYRVLWKDEPGFARVIHKEEALKKNTRVIPFYTKNCEQCLWSTAWWYTQSGRGVRYLMELFSAGNIVVLPIMMVLLLSSLGFFPLPAPVKMDTYFGEEIILRENETATEFAGRVKTELHALVDRVNGLPPRPFTRRQPLYRGFLGLFTFLQNIIIHCTGITLLLGVAYPVLSIMSFIRSLAGRYVQKSKKTL